MDFVINSHSISYKSKSFETRLFNGYLMIKRALLETLDLNVKIVPNESEDEDEIIDENLDFCADEEEISSSLAEKVSIQLSKTGNSKLLNEFESTVFFGYFSVLGTRFLESGSPDSNLWDRLNIAQFKDKEIFCDFRKSDTFKMDEERWKQAHSKSISFLAKEIN